MQNIYFNASLPVHEDMYFCRISHRLVGLHIHFLVSAVAHLDQIVFMAFLSHCNCTHQLTCLHRRFLSSIAALYRPTHPQGHFFPLTQLTQAISSTQMCSFLCRSLNRSIRPHKHSIATNMAHKGLLIHTDIFKFTQGSLVCETSGDYSPSQPIQGSHLEATHLNRQLGTHSCSQ